MKREDKMAMDAAEYGTTGLEFGWACWKAAVAAEREHVRVPTSADEAKAMATVAIAWLREHAPDELRPEFRA